LHGSFSLVEIARRIEARSGEIVRRHRLDPKDESRFPKGAPDICPAHTSPHELMVLG